MKTIRKLLKKLSNYDDMISHAAEILELITQERAFRKNKQAANEFKEFYSDRLMHSSNKDTLFDVEQLKKKNVLLAGGLKRRHFYI